MPSQEKPFTKESLDLIRKHRDIISKTAEIIGVSADAIAGAIAEEYSDSNKDISFVDRWQERVISMKFLFHDELLEEYALLHDGNHEGLLNSPSKLSKGWYTLLNDVGPGSIKIDTAITLLLEYIDAHPNDDPLSLKRYANDYPALIKDIMDVDSAATIYFAGLMLKKAEDFYSQNAPLAWVIYDKDIRDAVIITYYNLGQYRCESSLNQALATDQTAKAGTITMPDGITWDFPQYFPQPGPGVSGGTRYLANVQAVEDALGDAAGLPEDPEIVAKQALYQKALAAVILRNKGLEIGSFSNFDSSPMSDLITVELSKLSGAIGLNDLVTSLSLNSAFLYDDNANEAVGSSFNDLIMTFGGDDLLKGGSGNDELHGGDGFDTYIVGHDWDTIVDTDGRGQIFDGEGNPPLTGGQAISCLGPGCLYASEDKKYLYLFISIASGGSSVGSLAIIRAADLTPVALIRNFDRNREYLGITLNDAQLENGLPDYSGSTEHIAKQNEQNVVILTDRPADSSRAVSTGVGDDKVYGSSYDDVVFLGDGNDYAEGGTGNDQLYGGVGDDYLVGGPDSTNMDDNDYMVGGSGQDYLSGGAGDDIIITENVRYEEGDNGQTKGDWAVGGSGNDTIYGSANMDMLQGGSGADIIYGNGGDDIIFGDGNMALYMASRNWDTEQDPGRTTVSILNQEGQWIHKNGEDVDLYFDYHEYVKKFFSHVQWSIQRPGPADFAFLINWGGSGTWASSEDIDLINFGAANDILFGGAGNDHIYGQLGHDILDGGDGDDVLHGDDDTLHPLPVTSTGLSTEGNDFLFGGRGADKLYGGGGNDILYADASLDDLDPLNVFDDAQDQLGGDDGNDYLYAGSGRDLLFGGAGNDYLYGGRDALYLDGGDGNDYIVGAAMEDPDMASYIKGGAGDDVMIANTGVHNMEGGSGHDTYHFTTEHFKSGRGSAVIDDEDGDWTLVFDGRIFDGSQMVKVSPSGFHWRSLDNSFELIMSGNAEEGQGGKNLFFRWLDENGQPLGRALAVLNGYNQEGFARLNLPDWVEPVEIHGTEGDDVLIAPGDSKTIYGYGGNDYLEVQGGENTLIGGAGFDTYNFKSEILLAGDGLEDLVYDRDGSWELRLDGWLIHGSQTILAEIGENIAWLAKDGSYQLYQNGNSLCFQLLDQNGQGVGKIVRVLGAMDQNGYQALGLPQPPPPNQAPEISGVLSNQDLRLGQNFNLALPAGIFSDPDGDELSYQLAMADGSELPPWLNFDPASGTLSGYPGAAGSLALTLKAFDGQAYSPELAFQLNTLDGYIHGTSGDDTLQGTEQNDTIYGYAGNDSLYGGAGNDILIGGQGDDRLSGGAGNNIYIYNLGDGSDYIMNEVGSNDILRLGPDLTSEGMLLGNNNVVLSDGSILNVSTARLQAIEFADGTVWNNAYLRANLALVGDNGNNTIQMFSDSRHRVYGLGGDDRLIAHNSINAELYGGDGNDQLWGQAGNDLLVGGQGNDYLYAAGGRNTIRFARGDGQDTIAAGQEYISNHGYTARTALDDVYNIILFGQDLSLTDLQFEIIYKQENNRPTPWDLVIKIKDSQDQVTLKDFFPYGYFKELVFENGERHYLEDLMGLILPIEGGAGDDILRAVNGYGVVMDGGPGNDQLYGGGKNDTLIGGPGDDLLYGGVGDDVYVYNLGDGNDVIYENPDNWPGAGNNIIRFGAGINPEDVQVSRVKNVDYYKFDLVITFLGQPGQITVDNFYQYETSDLYPIIRFEFADGTVWGRDKIYPDQVWLGTSGDDYYYGGIRNDYIDGGAGSDYLCGEGGDDVLIGGRGDDYLDGGPGNDTYIFNRGDGRDVISEPYSGANRHEGINTLRFGPGITPAEIKIRQTMDVSRYTHDAAGRYVYAAWAGNYLVVTFQNSTGDQITINAYEDQCVIQVMEFADGTVWNLEDIYGRLTKTGTSAVDYLVGTNGNDVLDGLGGNDFLLGRAGNDHLKGGAGADNLYGGEGDNLLEGGDGDDNLFGNQGDDRLLGGKGNDFLEDLEGNNYFDGGEGNDIYYTDFGNSQTINNNGGGYDTLVCRDLDPYNAWFSRQGGDLVISAAQPVYSWPAYEQAGQITVTDWFIDASKQLDEVQTLYSWEKIINTQLNQLINAMASWNGYADFQAHSSQEQKDELNNLIANSWTSRY